MEEEKKENLEKNSEMGFLDHLEEMRWRIMKCLITIVLFAIGSFIYSDFFIEMLLLPAKTLMGDMTIQVLKVQGLLFLKFKVAFVMGLALSIPVIAYQFWAFVAPGLFPNERKWGPALVISVTFFFLVGISFAYFIIIPFALKFLIAIGTENIQKNISIEYYTKFVIQLIMASGIVFQMPILSFMLTKMGLVSHTFLRKYWRFAVLISMILAAFITPPDPISMIMMGIPLLFLYEISIYVSKVAASKPEEDGKNNKVGKEKK